MAKYSINLFIEIILTLQAKIDFFENNEMYQESPDQKPILGPEMFLKP